MSTEVRRARKGAYLLPNLITTLSMFFGFLSMIWTVQERFAEACIAILLSALLDGLDGKVARLTHTASEFGVQYDSLADAVAFGIAPALFIWRWQLLDFGNLGVAAAFIYAACGVLRLARFNISTAVTSKRFFLGLPIPAGGCTLVTYFFFCSVFPESCRELESCLALVLSVLVGILMVSKVRYFSFKEYDFIRAHPVRSLVSFFFLLGLLFSWPRIFGFILCLLYIICGLIYTYILLPRRDRQLTRAVSPNHVHNN
ncbi:MAG: CDP-diacylglycerol--serine O-phosphatidyltransferase [Desulfovibrio sp.]|nr:CDP-diacylglycerol--serine O-phosphatidyltransferase [Desulfovibrio sp.]